MTVPACLHAFSGPEEALQVVGHPSLVNGCYPYILPFVVVVCKALVDNVFLRFGKKIVKAIALPA